METLVYNFDIKGYFSTTYQAVINIEFSVSKQFYLQACITFSIRLKNTKWCICSVLNLEFSLIIIISQLLCRHHCLRSYYRTNLRHSYKKIAWIEFATVNLPQNCSKFNDSKATSPLPWLHSWLQFILNIQFSRAPNFKLKSQ